MCRLNRKKRTEGKKVTAHRFTSCFYSLSSLHLENYGNPCFTCVASCEAFLQEFLASFSKQARNPGSANANVSFGMLR